jgi:hypothetical protein
MSEYTAATDIKEQNSVNLISVAEFGMYPLLTIWSIRKVTTKDQRRVDTAI